MKRHKYLQVHVWQTKGDWKSSSKEYRKLNISSKDAKQIRIQSYLANNSTVVAFKTYLVIEIINGTVSKINPSAILGIDSLFCFPTFICQTKTYRQKIPHHFKHTRLCRWMVYSRVTTSEMALLCFLVGAIVVYVVGAVSNENEEC